MQPRTEPIGLDVNRTGRLLNKAFDDVLVAAGGSLPTWLILTALKRGEHTMQRDIAAVVGIEDATLTHHLNRMERDGLITRHRAVENRRNQVVALTDAGDALFDRLRGTVVGWDHQLRQGFTEAELAGLRGLLARLRTNVTAASGPVPTG